MPLYTYPISDTRVLQMYNIPLGFSIVGMFCLLLWYGHVRGSHHLEGLSDTLGAEALQQQHQQHRQKVDPR